jgi:3-hydroxybutyrate dehydrogenase
LARGAGAIRAPTGELQALNIAIKSENMNTRQALAGKVSLITGSTSGIGLGIARVLAAAGSEVVLNGFGKPEEVAAVQAKIASDFQVRVSYSPADMSKPEAIREMIENTLRLSGRLDVLVNNAGIQHVAPLQDFPPEKWDAILAINLSSAFHTTRLALPTMLQNKWGRIIALQSGLRRRRARHRRPDQGHGAGDCGTRHHLQRHLSRVRVHPAGASEGARHCAGTGYPRRVLLAQLPNKRFATVEELGALAVFLASAAAASITGVALLVDGGWTAH